MIKVNTKYNVYTLFKQFKNRGEKENWYKFRCVVVLPSASRIPAGSQEPHSKFLLDGFGFFQSSICSLHPRLPKSSLPTFPTPPEAAFPPTPEKEEVSSTICAFLESSFAKCPHVPCKSTFPQQMAYWFWLLVANCTIRIHLHSSLMEVFPGWQYIWTCTPVKLVDFEGGGGHWVTISSSIGAILCLLWSVQSVCLRSS